MTITMRKIFFACLLAATATVGAPGGLAQRPAGKAEASAELSKEQQEARKLYEKNSAKLARLLKKNAPQLAEADSLRRETGHLLAGRSALLQEHAEISAALVRHDSLLNVLDAAHRQVVDELTAACQPLLQRPVAELRADSLAEALLAARTAGAGQLRDDLAALADLAAWNTRCLAALDSLTAPARLAALEAEARRLQELPRLAAAHRQLLRQRLDSVAAYRADLQVLREAVVAVAGAEKFCADRAAASDKFSWENLRIRFTAQQLDERLAAARSRLRSATLRRAATEFGTEVVRTRHTRLERYFGLPAAGGGPDAASGRQE